MIKNIYFLAVISFYSCTLYAQDLYMPRNIKAAYAKKTRSIDGKPGAAYWQNSGKYNIEIKMDPDKGSLTGNETIIYTNSSPDTLTQLGIRLVNNIHKPTVIRGSMATPEFISEGFTINTVTVNSEGYEIDSKKWGTETSISLKKPLLPNTSITVAISWQYTFTKAEGREGRIDSTSYFAGYAYPRISVYDDCNGWDLQPYNGNVEFYNDFNDYELTVTVPRNYVVWATGVLQNPEEVLLPAIAERLKTSKLSDQIVKVASTEEMAAGAITKTNSWNHWKFSAKYISDVAFALSNHYQWDASSVVVDVPSGRRTSVQTAYGNNAPDYPNSVTWTREALHYFSSQWPAISYPYPTMTIFQGNGAMEFPMMVNEASIPDLHNSQRVHNHEIAHTYFPFYTGINETRYAFMDEGFAVLAEYQIGIAQYGKVIADSLLKNRIKWYISNSSAEQDLPIITLSTQTTGAAYRTNAYNKSALALLSLQSLLGEKTFLKSLHYFTDIWKGKHPTPWDFFKCIEVASGKKLDWFWKNWYYSNHYIDLAITAVKANTVFIKNEGGFAMPFVLVTYYEDGTNSRQSYPASIWQSGNKTIKLSLKTTKPIVAIELDNEVFMDVKPEDNKYVVRKSH